MVMKTITTRKFYPGRQGQFDGYPPTASNKLLVEAFSRDGVQQPKFKSLIKEGSSATTPMIVNVQNVHYRRPECKVIGLRDVYQLKRKGVIISTNAFDSLNVAVHSELPGTLLMSSVQNRALIGIIKKIRTNESSGLSGPTFLGELRETIGMIKSPFKALRLKTGLFTDLQMRVLRDKQARGRRAEEKWSKIISDTYLEWVFGARPLMADIAEILRVATDMRAKRLNGLKRLSFTYTDGEQVQGSTTEAIWSGTAIRVPYSQWSIAKSSCSYVVWIDESLIFADGPMDWLIQANKFDLYEVIPTAWELMPWSFLIDYFTNIGDVLGCTFNYNRNVKFSKRTDINQVIKFHAPREPVCSEPLYQAVISYKPWSYTSTYKQIKRSVVPSLGFPQLETTLPSLGQSLNIAALFTSLSKSNPFRGFTLK